MESKTTIGENNFINSGKRWSKEHEDYLKEKVIGFKGEKNKTVSINQLKNYLHRTQAAIELRTVEIWQDNAKLFDEDRKRIIPIGNKFLTYDNLGEKRVCPSNVRMAWGVYGDGVNIKKSRECKARAQHNSAKDVTKLIKESKLKHCIKSKLMPLSKNDTEKPVSRNANDLELDSDSDITSDSDLDSDSDSDSYSDDELDIDLKQDNNGHVIINADMYNRNGISIWPQIIDMKEKINEILAECCREIKNKKEIEDNDKISLKVECDAEKNKLKNYVGENYNGNKLNFGIDKIKKIEEELSIKEVKSNSLNEELELCRATMDGLDKFIRFGN